MINVTPQQRENVIDKMELGDTILNSDINLPGFESMSEREQMIFVINYYKKLHDMLRIHINDDSVYDILEGDSKNPDYMERLYTYNGEYQELKFK
jgi:hypothetical protein